MFKRLPLSYRITTLGSVVILAFCVVSATLYPRLKARLLAEKQEKTRNLVESAASIIEHYVAQEKSGAISREQAQNEARQLVASLRYDDGNYYWINDLYPRMVMHPIKPTLDGQDLSDLADPNGKRLFVEMAKVARSEGSGFVDYHWPKPGQEEPDPKLSFVKLQPDWGWVIGSGIYVDDVKAQLASLFFFLYGSIAALAVGSTLAFYFVARGISSPIDRIISKIERGSRSIEDAAGQVSNCSTNLAEEAIDQAGSIALTVSSVEDMKATTASNSTHSEKANSLMEVNAKILSEASDSMGRLTSSMREITEASEKTSHIVKTIDEIAFQTNLLALNAAVEAARAGEAGAGFAVVADEVRGLAQRAAKAARDTGGLIEHTVDKIADGARLVSETSESFSQASTNRVELLELIQNIAAATRTQNDGIQNINTSISEIDRITQQNAANAEESAAAAQELNGEAHRLRSLIDDLAAVVGGKREATPASPPERPRKSAPRRELARQGEWASFN